MISAFTQEHGLESAEVCVELADGSRHVLATATAEPGFGFFSFAPHRVEGEEPRHVSVPIGAVRSIENLGVSAPEGPTHARSASRPRPEPAEEVEVDAEHDTD